MQGQNNNDVNQPEYNVPVNESLKERIPVGQKVILSTHIGVRYSIAKPSGGAKKGALTFLLTGSVAGAVATSGMRSNFHGIYYTDALVTEEGLALNLPSFYMVKNGKKMERKPPSPQFISWRNIHFPVTYDSYRSFEIDSTYKCHLINKKDCGTSEQFHIHSEQFFNSVPEIREACVLKYNKAVQSAANLEAAQLEEITQFVLDFLRRHSGKAFTNESLKKHLRTEIASQEWLEYLEVNLKGVLNKFLFTGEIESNEHEGKLFYFSPN